MIALGANELKQFTFPLIEGLDGQSFLDTNSSYSQPACSLLIETLLLILGLGRSMIGLLDSREQNPQT
jgi:hypothetical protein